MLIETKFSNGDLLRDKVTGLEGIVMVVAKYSTGCIHYGIMPRKIKDDGSLCDWSWLDQSRFELIKNNAVLFNINGDFGTSGPEPTGPQM